MKEEILVSIICNTYNHEKYISDALESFLMQKTNFKYEVLVHDDASTDKTVEIIKKYKNQYPDIIIPKYQSVNQYSKKIKINSEFQFPRAKGKYVALCEGDDYWTDPYKLQKQVDFMENNPDCSLCVHAASMVNADTKDNIGEMRPSVDSRYFSVAEVIEGGGGLFATNSMMFKVNSIHNLPKFYINAPVGDYPLCIYLAVIGKLYYIDEFMSSYRANATGSWSIRMQDKEKRHAFNKGIVEMLNSINQYTNGVCNHSIKKVLVEFEYNLALLENKVRDVQKPIYRDFYIKLSRKQKIRLYLGAYLPYVLKQYDKIKMKNRCKNG